MCKPVIMQAEPPFFPNSLVAIQTKSCLGSQNKLREVKKKIRDSTSQSKQFLTGKKED